MDPITAAFKNRTFSYAFKKRVSKAFFFSVGITVFFTLIGVFSNQCFAQHTSIKGTVIDEFTKEKIPFASIHWKKAKYGVQTDSAGNFKLVADGFTKDSIQVSYVGMETKTVAINTKVDTGFIKIVLETAKKSEGVVVKSKNSRGYYWWKNLVKHKPQNDPFQYNSYSYGLYNKLEIDIENINKEKFKTNKLLKPFAFILKNIDSVTEDKPFLPMFFTESISDCYYSTTPNKKREEIKALLTNGIKNESIMQYVGGINQRINAYQNYIVMFNKEFISPINPAGDQYYNYIAADTQYIGGDRYLHLFFQPKRDGENTFNGECWIYQKTWALQRITLNSSPSANINFVNRISIVQEFAKQNDSTWVFAKDKFVTDISLTKKEKLAFIARKTHRAGRRPTIPEQAATSPAGSARARAQVASASPDSCGSPSSRQNSAQCLLDRLTGVEPDDGCRYTVGKLLHTRFPLTPSSEPRRAGARAVQRHRAPG